jgi:hypothetical protein
VATSGPHAGMPCHPLSNVLPRSFGLDGCGWCVPQVEAAAAAAKVSLPGDMVALARSQGLRSTAFNKYLQLQVRGGPGEQGGRVQRQGTAVYLQHALTTQCAAGPLRKLPSCGLLHWVEPQVCTAVA